MLSSDLKVSTLEPNTMLNIILLHKAGDSRKIELVLFFFFNFYLLMIVTEREREAET